MGKLIRKAATVLLVLIAALCAVYLAWYYLRTPELEKPGEEYRKPTVVETKEGKKIKIPVDFAKLKEVNPEVCAWIDIEGTKMDYPIVQSQKGEEYYLRHNWEGEYSGAGAIFIQNYNHDDFSDFNTVIYGHRIGNADTSMFHGLYGYMEEDFFRKHQQITVYTPDHIRTYKVFASVVYDDRLIPVEFDGRNREERTGFLKSIYDSEDTRNQFAEDIQVTEEDQIITLSTCLEFERHHRYLVLAVLEDEQ